MTRVLVVDDEAAIRESVGFALRREGFEVDEAVDGREALEAARTSGYDVILLDLLLPHVSGLDVCRELRRDGAVPIIMLTARTDVIDRVVGLEVGADDYVTKPFSVAEVVSRVGAILRRRRLDSDAASVRVDVGGVAIDLASHEVAVDGAERRLTPSEFRILALLAGSPGRVFSRREIMEALWQSGHVDDTRACDTHVSNLRRKIERDPARPERLLTVRGAGYRLVPV